MRSTGSFIARATLLALTAVAAGCQPVDPIVVIAAFNITGPEAVLDDPAFKGAELAVEQINASGGVLGRPIELIPVDTESDVDGTAQKIETALRDYPRTVAGIGFSYSTFALEAGRVFQSAGRPFITSGATAPDLPEEVGDDMFLAAYGDDAQARVMARYARDQLQLERVALWMDTSRVYPRTVGRFFGELLEELGGSVETHAYAAGKTDFADLIQAFQAMDPAPQAIYGATMPGSAVPLIEQVRAAGIDVPLLSGDGWADQNIVAASARDSLGGIYFTTHQFLGVETPAADAFAEFYREKFGEAPPNAFAPLGFDSVNLLADAIRRAGSAEPSAIQAALAETRDFQGVVGTISYAPGKRVPDKAVAVVEIQYGVETPVWTWTPEGQQADD